MGRIQRDVGRACLEDPDDRDDQLDRLPGGDGDHRRQPVRARVLAQTGGDEIGRDAVSRAPEATVREHVVAHPDRLGVRAGRDLALDRRRDRPLDRVARHRDMAGAGPERAPRVRRP